MNITNVATPNIDDTPISCHNKYVTTIVCRGLIQKKCIKNSALSNRFTSFDNKLTTRPTDVSPNDVLLSRKA